MKVLIACEESQEVCKAFREKGHEAYSCDILPCSGGHPEWHLQGDVLEQLNKDWDMIIGFPPCTHLAVSGARHFAQKIKDGRQHQGIDFFMALANAKCNKIALENPVSIMSSRWRKPDQIIQPYMFGHEAKKTTCLWLKGLPKLKPTKIVSEGEFYISPNGAKMPKWLSDPVDKNGKKIAYNSQEIKILRSKTFPGVAQAMAEQWGTVGNFTLLADNHSQRVNIAGVASLREIKVEGFVDKMKSKGLDLLLTPSFFEPTTRAIFK